MAMKPTIFHMFLFVMILSSPTIYSAFEYLQMVHKWPAGFCSNNNCTRNPRPNNSTIRGLWPINFSMTLESCVRPPMLSWWSSYSLMCSLEVEYLFILDFNITFFCTVFSKLTGLHEMHLGQTLRCNTQQFPSLFGNINGKSMGLVPWTCTAKVHTPILQPAWRMMSTFWAFLAIAV